MSSRTGTDGSLLASLPWTLAALTFSVLAHLNFLPIWVTIAFVACAALRWQIERKRWRLPAAWLRIVLALACFMGILATYESVSGVGPGSALLAIMAALKLLETRRRRDQFVLLFISVFLVMASLLREQHLWSLPYMIVGVWIITTAWLRMSVVHKIGIRQSSNTAARLIAYAAPLAVAMWFFFPRIATPFWAVPIDTSSATSGFSERMSPGDISSLSQSNAVAFRVKFEGSVPAPAQRYWRGLILNRFNGRTWSGNEPSYGSNARQDIEYLGEPVRYQITMEPTGQQWVFALDIPYEWDLKRTFMAAQQQLARPQPIDQRTAYNVVSYPNFRLNSELGSFWRNRYTRIPENSNRRTINLSQQLRQAASSDEHYINTVLQKFHNEEYFYTLEPPALGSDSVDKFLFDTRRGFCEHFASAFAVMMRAAGVPARIVVGYQGGEENPLGGYMIVRQSDAHAWVEVWLPNRGWYRVDPTAAVAPERIESGMTGAMFDGIAANWGLGTPSELLYQITLTWDALSAKWNELVLGYGPENQSRLMEWLGMENPDWRKMMLTLLLIVIVLITAISLLLIRRYRPPPKDKAARLYRKFTNNAGIDPKLGETPSAYSLRLAQERTEVAEDAERVTAQYLDARYGAANLVAVQRLQSAVAEFSRNH